MFPLLTKSCRGTRLKWLRLPMRTNVLMGIYYCAAIAVQLACCEALIVHKAKFVGNLRVADSRPVSSYTTKANSVRQCLAICNKDRTCDGINYFTRLSKCRIFKRCSPVQMIQISPFYLYYTKRPPIETDDYVYEKSSDTCLKVNKEKADYNRSVELCNEHRNRLLVISSTNVLNTATKLLKESEYQSAWVHYSTKRNELLSKFYTDKIKLMQATNVATDVSKKKKKCWLLWSTGKLEETFCSVNQHHNSLCQLGHY